MTPTDDLREQMESCRIGRYGPNFIHFEILETLTLKQGESLDGALVRGLRDGTVKPVFNSESLPETECSICNGPAYDDPIDGIVCENGCKQPDTFCCVLRTNHD